MFHDPSKLLCAVAIALAAVATPAVVSSASVAGGDVLARAQAIVSASPTAALASSANATINTEVPSDIAALLSTNSIQWTQVSDIVRSGLLYAYGYVLPGANTTGGGAVGTTPLKVYTACGDASANSTVSESALGIPMEQIAVSYSTFNATGCQDASCDAYHKGFNDACTTPVMRLMQCKVEVNQSTNAWSNSAFWSDAGDNSSAVPLPQAYVHQMLIVEGSASPAMFVGIHMNGVATKQDTCASTDDTVVPCLAADAPSDWSNYTFCRPKVDDDRVKTLLAAVA